MVRSNLPSRIFWKRCCAEPFSLDGSLRYRILGFSLSLPRPKTEVPLRLKFPDLKIQQRDGIPKEMLDKVCSLFGENFYRIARKRPRRYIYIDERNRGLLREHPQLRPFVRGAYTSDDMEIIPSQGRLRGIKRKRSRTEPEPDASNQKRAKMPDDRDVPSNKGLDSKGKN